MLILVGCGDKILAFQVADCNLDEMELPAGWKKVSLG
jgi:hypothetical protein